MRLVTLQKVNLGNILPPPRNIPPAITKITSEPRTSAAIETAESDKSRPKLIRGLEKFSGENKTSREHYHVTRLRLNNS